MAAVTTSAQGSDAPAPGQLVTVRNRMWVASDVVKGNVAAGDAVTMTGRPPHVVTLVSIEDDARDERLRVVWELERGAVLKDLLPGFYERAEGDVTLLGPRPDIGFGDRRSRGQRRFAAGDF